LWDAKSGALLHTLEHDSRARRAAVHPDGGYVATIADDTVLRIWRIGAGAPEVVSRVPFDGEVRRVAFSPDGRRIVYGGTLSSTLWQPEDLIAALCARAGC
jgi:WD40 repeat protein